MYSTMLSTRLLSRCNTSPYANMISRLHTSIISFDSSSSSSSDSDKKTPKKKKTKEERQERRIESRRETNERLNSLLENMMTKPKAVKTIEHTVAAKKVKTEKPKIKKQPYEVELFEATKAVATSLGGDEKKTESELLNKLLAIDNDESDAGQKSKRKPLDLKDFIAGMNIERTPVEPKKSTDTTTPSRSAKRSAQVETLAKKFQSFRPANSTYRSSDERSRYDNPSEPGNLYAGENLNIFDISSMKSDTANMPELATWEILEKKEFKLALTHPPENIFQEMIMWTEQGKLWKFPIDNEQDLDEERSIHFSEHVFMERHLKDWCPKRGPIRHFMQLVCVGLSKNPYMTVREKQEHIAWYRDYFASKQQLLKEIGAIETPIPQRNEISA